MEGNNKSMREALENFARYEESDIRQLEHIAKKMIDRCEYGGGIIQAIAGAIREAKVALAAPPRNCDIGSPEEQAQRMEKFCNSHGHGFDGQKCYSCENCKLISVDWCELAWAQMPYEEGGAE